MQKWDFETQPSNLAQIVESYLIPNRSMMPLNSKFQTEFLTKEEWEENISRRKINTPDIQIGAPPDIQIGTTPKSQRGDEDAIG